MNNKYAIVYAGDFNTWKMRELSIRSVRHFHPNMDIYILTYGNACVDDRVKCKKIGVTCIDISKIFDEKFPFFKAHGKDYHVLSNGRKYPKITFARFLVPYIQELQHYDKVLYLDDDTVVCQSLDSILLDNYGRWITVGFDGQTCHQRQCGRIYWNIHRYDYWKILCNYVCAGVLLFSFNVEQLCEYDAFIDRICVGQEKIIAFRKEFLTCQDMLNLYCHYQLTKGKKVASKKWAISDETAIYHYYGIKNNENFEQLILDKLSQANKDIQWLL